MAEDEANAVDEVAGDTAQAAPTHQAVDKSAERWQTIVVAAITAMVGITGVAGTIIASWLQVDAMGHNQQAQFAEEDRNKKADAYLNFLDAANMYAVATENARDCFIQAREATPPGKRSYSFDSTCVQRINNLASTRHDFQRARNKVFVYGSDVAELRATAIASYLPPAVGGDPATGLPPIDEALLNYEDAHFNQLYRDFNRLICQEVPAQPRESCD